MTMVQTDNPRLHLCAACVTLRGLEGNGRYVRVAEGFAARGACADCAAVGELEMWRMKEAPPAAETLRAFPDSERLPTVRPYLTRISIKPDEREKEKKTASGLIIPATSAVEGEPTRTGVVLAVGSKARGDVREGDWVLYYERPALAFEGADGLVHVIDVGDVLAVLQEGDALAAIRSAS